MIKHLLEELKEASHSMFHKNFMGIFHGSISAKIESGKFIINTKDAVFNNLKDSDFIELYEKRDYRWSDASIDAHIHLKIYQNISEAKYVTYTMAPFMTSYALRHDKIVPKDYFGITKIGTLPVFEMGDPETWYKRADSEIESFFNENRSDMVIIKGYGLYSYNRDLPTLIKKIAILENSCKLLVQSKSLKNDREYPLS